MEVRPEMMRPCEAEQGTRLRILLLRLLRGLLGGGDADEPKRARQRFLCVRTGSLLPAGWLCLQLTDVLEELRHDGVCEPD